MSIPWTSGWSPDAPHSPHLTADAASACMTVASTMVSSKSGARPLSMTAYASALAQAATVSHRHSSGPVSTETSGTSPRISPTTLRWNSITAAAFLF